MKEEIRLYGQMFFTFLKIGAFTLGGGYAMIPLVQGEVVDKKHWIEQEEFLNMLALAQSAPGVMAVNTAIFIGYKMRGWKGVIATTLGSILPSFVIILLIATAFTRFREMPTVEAIFKGIRPAVVALIAAPLYKMAKSAGMMRTGQRTQDKGHRTADATEHRTQNTLSGSEASNTKRFSVQQREIILSWVLLLIPICVALLIWLCDISPIWIILFTIIAAVAVVFFQDRQHRKDTEHRTQNIEH